MVKKTETMAEKIEVSPTLMSIEAAQLHIKKLKKDGASEVFMFTLTDVDIQKEIDKVKAYRDGDYAYRIDGIHEKTALFILYDLALKIDKRLDKYEYDIEDTVLKILKKEYGVKQFNIHNS